MEWMTLEYHELELPPRLDVVVLRDHHASPTREVTARRTRSAHDDVMQIAPVRVTTPLRTATGPRLPAARDGLRLAALDQFARSPRHHRAQICDRSCLASADDGASSSCASCRRCSSRAPSRPPSPGFASRCSTPACLRPSSVLDPRRWTERFRLDLAYPNHRVCIEYDGEDSTPTPADVEPMRDGATGSAQRLDRHRGHQGRLDGSMPSTGGPARSRRGTLLRNAHRQRSSIRASARVHSTSAHSRASSAPTREGHTRPLGGSDAATRG